MLTNNMDASSQYIWNTKFISEIERRPGLWNQSVKSRDSQKQLWDELSELFDKKSVDSLRRKYNNLKARFRQQLTIIPQTNNNFDVDPRLFESEWPHYRHMLFLLNEIDTKPNEKRKATIPEPILGAKRKRLEDIDDKCDDDQQCGNELPSTSVPNKQIMEDCPDDIEVKPDIFPNPPPEDGVYHFLMGLYDFINDLDPIRKINVQAKIYQMLNQEVAASTASNSKKTNADFS